MNIGIDIDDTLVDSTKNLETEIVKYDTSGDVVKYIEEIMSGGIPTENVRKFLEDHSLEVLGNADIKENAVDVIKRLKAKGHNIFFITSRSDEICMGEKELTINYFKRYGVLYDGVYFDSKDKAKVCKELNVDIMIDDSIRHCESIEKAGIKAFLFTSGVNIGKDTNVKRVDDWLMLEKEIEKYIEGKADGNRR